MMIEAAICFLCLAASLLGVGALYMVQRDDHRRTEWFDRQIRRSLDRIDEMREVNELDYILALKELETLKRAQRMEDDDD
ncbi:MAG: hypothetical protein IIZ83_06690 [Oscillospiraceae bacterium]|nr:hypothetical protein [Oscillospiraceae bacterium]